MPNGAIAVTLIFSMAILHAPDLERDADQPPLVWLFTANPSIESDEAQAAAVDKNGSLFVAGFDSRPVGNWWRVTRLVSNGTEDWTWRVNPSASWDSARSIALDGTGAVYVAGHDNSPGTNDVQWRVVKLYQNGTESWTWTWNPTPFEDAAFSVAAAVTGGVYVAGWDNGPADIQWRVVKLRSNGTEEWNWSSNPSSGSDYPNAVVVDPAGGAYVAGLDSVSGDTRWRVVKLRANGTEEWVWISDPSSSSDGANAIAITKRSELYVVGYDNASGSLRWRVVALDSSGSEKWNWTSKPSGTPDFATSVAANAAGTLYVAGILNKTSVSNGDSLWRLVKLQSNGSEVWNWTANPSQYTDEARAVAVEDRHFAYVAGFDEIPYERQWRVVKLGPFVEANSSAIPTAGIVHLRVDFSCAASGGSGNYTSYSWEFGDGGSGSGSSVSHVYTTAGVYEAKCTVRDDAWDLGESVPVIITASWPGLIVAASATPTSGEAPQAVNFTCSASGGSGSYRSFNWTFGDGKNGSGSRVSHTYSMGGKYQTQCFVEDDSGNKNQSNSVAITISWPGITVDAKALPTSGMVPLLVNFTCTASGGSGVYPTYIWTFGDGQAGTGPNASHLYGGIGLFSAACAVTDGAGNTTQSNPVMITVSWPDLIANASAKPDTGQAPLTVEFICTATGGSGSYASFNWAFGDGSVGGGSTTSHMYSAPGGYRAHCVVLDDKGNRGASNSVEVSVSARDPDLLASANASTHSGEIPLTIRFSCSGTGGTGNFTSFEWSFGDGSLGSGSSTSHTYHITGTFDAVCRITDTGGASDTSGPIRITVSAPNRTSTNFLIVGGIGSAIGTGAALVFILLRKRKRRGAEQHSTTGHIRSGPPPMRKVRLSHGTSLQRREGLEPDSRPFRLRR